MKSFNNSYKLFVGVLALVLVAGMSNPAYAQIRSEVAPLLNGENGEEDFCETLRFISTINCYLSEPQQNLQVIFDADSFCKDVFFDGICQDAYDLTFGPPACLVDVEDEFLACLDRERPIGGTVGSMSTTSLLVAGAQANMGLWSLALVGIVGAGAAIIYKTKSKKTEK